MFQAHDVAAVANEFIRLAREEGRILTNMRLQKLPYIAQGWSLALRNGQPLIEQPVEAWFYGPVYRRLYNSLAQYGSGPVSDYIHENDGNPFRVIDGRGGKVKSNFTNDDLALIQAVWNNYRDYGAYQLSALTRRRDVEWPQVTKNVNYYITNENIKEYYCNLLKSADAS